MSTFGMLFEEIVKTAADFKVGGRAQVYSFGHWYTGTVAKVSKVCVWVTYTTGSGTTRTKAYNPAKGKIR